MMVSAIKAKKMRLAYVDALSLALNLVAGCQVASRRQLPRMPWGSHLRVVARFLKPHSGRDGSSARDLHQDALRP